MIDQAQTDKFKEILGLCKNTLVIFPETKNLDLFLASYAFYIFLAESGVRLLSPKFKLKIPSELADFIEDKNVETELGKENLLISFPYQEEQVDNVSYYIGEQDKRFYLTIKPKKGVAPLDSSNLEFSYAGSQADLIVLFGVEDLESLEQLYFAYEALYKGTNNHLVTIDNFIPDFGNLNLDISPTNSYCEALFYLLKDLEKKDSDVLAKTNIPTLLLYGIESKNMGLQSKDTDADTFLAVSQLLQLGAMRLFSLGAVTTTESAKKPAKANGKSQVHLIK